MRDKRSLYEGLASLVQAGIPLDRALASLADGAGGERGAVLRHLAAGAAAGRPLADGMAGIPAAFEPFETELIRAGESVGGLERALRALARREEDRARVRGRILAACAYPAFVLLLVPVPLNIAHLVRGTVGGFVLRYVMTLAPALVAVAVLVALDRTPAGRRLLRGALLRLPWFGSMAADRAWIRWARAYAAMEDAGLPPRRAAEQAARTVGLPRLEDPLLAAAARLDGGSTRAEALAAAGLPGGLLSAVAAGEVAGDLTRQLERAADAVEVRADARLSATLAALPVAAIVLAGIAVFAAAWRILGGYYGQALR